MNDAAFCTRCGVRVPLDSADGTIRCTKCGRVIREGAKSDDPESLAPAVALDKPPVPEPVAKLAVPRETRPRQVKPVDETIPASAGDRMMRWAGIGLCIVGFGCLLGYLFDMRADVLGIFGAALLFLGPLATMAGAAILAASLRRQPLAALVTFFCVVGLMSSVLLVDVFATFYRNSQRAAQAAREAHLQFSNGPGSMMIPPAPEIHFPEIHFPNRHVASDTLVLEAPELTKPESELSVAPYDAEELVGTGVAGSGDHQRAEDKAPENGLLVGLRVIQGRSWGGAVRAIQPVYQIGDRYQYGERLGQPGGEVSQTLLLAKPGHAVCGASVRRGLVINAVRLIYCPVVEGQLETENAYSSGWVGSRGGGEQPALETFGRPAIGVGAHYADDLIGLRLLSVMKLGKPQQELPALAYDKTDFTSTAGRSNGPTFRDRAPDGGALVGMRVSKGKNWGGVVGSLQPIYHVGDSYRLGSPCGDDSGQIQQWLAKPGYCVGAIETCSSLVINAVRLHYYRTDGQRLDPADSYSSDWIGVVTGQQARLDGNGTFLVGITGTANTDLWSLAVELARQ